VSKRKESCAGCGHVRRVYARLGGEALCPSCYRARLRCTRCDHLGVGSHGLCWGCLLGDRVDELRVRAGAERGERLAGYLDALALSSNPQSTLRWMQMPAFALVEDVVGGCLELSHRAFDERQGARGEGSAIAYLRAALVAHGALPERDETAAAFERWLARALPEAPDGPDRATITAFATWQGRPRACRDGRPPPRSAAAIGRQARPQSGAPSDRPDAVAARAEPRSCRLAPGPPG
jgi:hypothetical protein